ncbi:MAG: (Fe-S)-binding protein [Candidatus Binataceae bacterium]|jgi:Fe-S oxidoreductase
MNEQITRQILWNVPTAFVVIMYALLVLLIAAFVYAGMYWYRRISLGTAIDRSDQPMRRAMLSLRDAIGQGYVVRESSGWMHYSFYVAFVGLLIGTTIVAINSDVRDFAAMLGVPLYFYYGDFYLIFKAAMDTCFLMLIGGLLASAARRFLRQPGVLASPPADKLLDNLENQLGYWFPLLMLTLVAITGLMLEGARINANPPVFAEWAYAGRIMAAIEGALGAGVLFHRFLWAIHVLFVYAMLFAIPFSKIRHILIAPINLYFRNLKPRGRLEPIKDFETAETFGVSQIEQYTWKQLLDMAACLECGRCTINCPTASTDKTLNPKFLVISQREHLLDKAPALLAARAATNGNGKAAEVNYSGPDMIAEVATEPAIWGCTTCGWCEEGCPVGIEHIQRIVDMRRNLVLMESRFPQEVTGAFKGMEVQGNPWGLGQEKRADWAKGLDIPVMGEIEDPSSIDVLYWVGCAGSYDERAQKVSRAFAALMKQAGVRFAILGVEETCTGDTARRLGNEYLYATMVAQNVETLNRYKPRRIVTQCPHCFHNLKNEYPDFGGNYQVIHSAEFIAELIAAGRLKPDVEIAQRVTYHDPCYMARHNRMWEGARSAIAALPGSKLTDIAESKNRTFCCGAGGGGFWKEEERKGERINERRFEMINQASPDTIGVGCPFCMTMVEDAVKGRSLEESMRVRDIIEIVAESTGAITR